MKRRPLQTTSERELLAALAEGGRIVSLAMLVQWRRDGLLPAFSSHGEGRGRTYYWRETDIVAQAETAFDLTLSHGRQDFVVLTLFLSGFAVPLVNLRRAWQSRTRLRQPWKMNFSQVPAYQSHHPGELIDGDAGSTSCDFSWFCDHFFDVKRDERAIDMAVERVARQLANTDILDGFAIGRLWPALKMLGQMLEFSDLISSASDGEILKAHSYLKTFAPAFQRALDDLSRVNERRGRVALWSFALAENLGPPLFLLILMMLRSDKERIVNKLARLMDVTPGLSVFPTSARLLEIGA